METNDTFNGVHYTILFGGQAAKLQSVPLLFSLITFKVKILKFKVLKKMNGFQWFRMFKSNSSVTSCTDGTVTHRIHLTLFNTFLPEYA